MILMEMVMARNDELGIGQDDLIIHCEKQRPAMKAVVGLLGCIPTRRFSGAYSTIMLIEIWIF